MIRDCKCELRQFVFLVKGYCIQAIFMASFSAKLSACALSNVNVFTILDTNRLFPQYISSISADLHK